MNLPVEIRALYRRWLTAFPIPHGSAGPDIEDACRQWATRFAEQVAFTTDDLTWGTKRAGAGRPLSKDTLARMVVGHLFIWDLISGAGTGNGQAVNPDTVQSADITGQLFEPVTPQDHLHTTPDPDPMPDPFGTALAALQRMDAAITAMSLTLDAVATRPAPIYTGSLFGYTITLKPG